MSPPPMLKPTTVFQLDYRSNMRVSPTASTSSSSLPISGERHVTSAARSIPISSTAKRQRLDDGSHAMQPAPASLGANSNHIGSPTFPYRIDIDLPSYSSPGGTSMIPSLSQLHSQHPSLTALYANTSSSMSNIMSGGGGSSFLPQSPFDLSRGHNAALRTVSFPPAGSSPYSPQQQQSNNLFARPQGGGQGQHSHGGSHAHGGASNMFADLLGTAGEHGNGAGHGGGGPGQFPTFDWPVHAASQGSQQSGQGQHENGASVVFRGSGRDVRACAYAQRAPLWGRPRVVLYRSSLMPMRTFCHFLRNAAAGSTHAWCAAALRILLSAPTSVSRPLSSLSSVLDVLDHVPPTGC